MPITEMGTPFRAADAKSPISQPSAEDRPMQGATKIPCSCLTRYLRMNIKGRQRLPDIVSQHHATLHFVVCKSVADIAVAPDSNKCIRDDRQGFAILTDALRPPSVLDRELSNDIHRATSRIWGAIFGATQYVIG